MQLTKQTDFAFRILIYLGHLPAGEKAQIQQVCDFYDISSNHIAKVVVKLAKLGYINAYRGKGGGIELARPSCSISLADVVRDFETGMKPVNCEQPLCRISGSCELKGILFAAMQAFMGEMGRHTLADLLENSELSEQVLRLA